MLRHSRILIFPKLVRIGEAPLAHGNESKDLDIYVLDWSKHQANTEHWSSKDKSYSALPEQYNRWVDNFEFAIPKHYMSKIRDFSQKGLSEWDGDYPFDTAVVGVCLEPAIAYIYAAFWLLKDCLYDKDAQYYSRDPKKFFAHNALLKRFWWGQTGRGMTDEYSRIYELEDRIQHMPLTSDDGSVLLEKFLTSMKDHRNRIEDAIQGIASPDGATLAAYEDNSKAIIEGKRIVYSALEYARKGNKIVSESGDPQHGYTYRFDDGKTFSNAMVIEKAKYNCDANMTLRTQELVKQLLPFAVNKFTPYLEANDEHDVRYLSTMDEVLNVNDLKGRIININGNRFAL